MKQRSRHSILALILLSVLGLWFAPSARGQVVPPIGPLLPASVVQTAPALTTIGGGDHLLAWTQLDGARSEIRAKRLEHGVNDLARAADQGQPFARSATAGWMPGEQAAPAFGPGFMVWSEKRPGGADFDLYTQRYGPSGLATGSPMLILARPGDQRQPAVAADRVGELMLVWEETNAAGDADLWGARLTGALMPRGAAFLVAGGPSNAQEPAIAADPDDGDGYLVAWSDNRAGNQDLYGLLLTRTGLPEKRGASAEFALQNGPEDEFAPSLVIDPSQNTGTDMAGLLAWWHAPQPGTNMGAGVHVSAQRLRRNGLAYGKPFLVSPDVYFDAQPAVAQRAPEGWVAVWARSDYTNDAQPGTTSTPDPYPAPATATPASLDLDLWGTTIDRNARVGRPARPVVQD